jgi:hypothetical protein
MFNPHYTIKCFPLLSELYYTMLRASYNLHVHLIPFEQPEPYAVVLPSLFFLSSLFFLRCNFLSHLFLLLIAARLVRPHG